MNFLLAPRKDDKYRSHPLCLNCKNNFKCHCSVRIRSRVNHVGKLKLENIRRALSHYGSSINACCTVLAHPCKAIGASTRVRMRDRTCFGKGSSSSDFSKPLSYIGSASNNSSSFSEDGQESAERMPVMFLAFYLAVAVVAFAVLANSQGPNLLLHPVTLELQRAISNEILLPLCSRPISLNVALVTSWTPSMDCHHSCLSICQMLQLTLLVNYFTLSRSDRTLPRCCLKYLVHGQANHLYEVSTFRSSSKYWPWSI